MLFQLKKAARLDWGHSTSRSVLPSHRIRMSEWFDGVALGCTVKRLIPTLILPLLSPVSVAADPSLAPLAVLSNFGERAYLAATNQAETRAVNAYTVPLGAIQKVRGQWAPRKSERLSGTLYRYTWQVANGFSSEEVVNDLVEELADDARFELIYSCEARACGSSVQWANRIFEERLLYGREVSQRYFVYRVIDVAEGGASVPNSSAVVTPLNNGDQERSVENRGPTAERSPDSVSDDSASQVAGKSVGRLLLYASARSSNRQYLHGEFLEQTSN